MPQRTDDLIMEVKIIMTDSLNTGKQIILPIQGLKAIAFIGIFLPHTDMAIFSSFWPWGVSIFIILSGFLMMINYNEKQMGG